MVDRGGQLELFLEPKKHTKIDHVGSLVGVLKGGIYLKFKSNNYQLGFLTWCFLLIGEWLSICTWLRYFNLVGEGLTTYPYLKSLQ